MVQFSVDTRPSDRQVAQIVSAGYQRLVEGVEEDKLAHLEHSVSAQDMAALRDRLQVELPTLSDLQNEKLLPTGACPGEI